MKTCQSYTQLLSKKILAIVALLIMLSPVFAQPGLPSPKEHFGFEPGTDKMLFNYESLIDYMMRLFRLSDKMYVEQIGESEMGKPMYAVFISSAENIKRLSELKEINRQLALNGALGSDELDNMIQNGKTFVLFSMSMHSTEVGPSQATPDIVYDLLTLKDKKTEFILDNTVCVIVPNHNPDGMNMIVDNYNKYKDTPLEGCSNPGVYHKYVGHNINRDFVMLTQKENRAVASLYNNEWFPQVVIQKHQMGTTGPRYFVSPSSDPIAENVDAGVWNWIRIFGSQALTDMTKAGLKGVSTNYYFDDYWPGSVTTCIWKGIIGMLSECASVNIASPVYVEPGEFVTIGKGLGEYAKSINLTEPWPGGWWRLSDIFEYERVNTMSYLYTAALHKEDILRFRNTYTRSEIEKCKNEPPYYYILPDEQHDRSELVSLVNLMEEHGVETFQLMEKTQIDGRVFNAGDIVIPLSQPYRAFIKEVMEIQKFPERHYVPEGELIKPYDITSWSLPLHKGLSSYEIRRSAEHLDKKIRRCNIPFDMKEKAPEQFNYMLFSANDNESYKAAFYSLSKGMEVRRTTEAFKYNEIESPIGSFIIKSGYNNNDLLEKLNVSPVFISGNNLPESDLLKLPRIALVESWYQAMDAGWARYLFDSYYLPFTVIRPLDLQEINLSARFDVVIFTDESKSLLMEGKFGREGAYIMSRYPPEFSKGMEKKGLDNVLQFINQGGTVLSWGRSVDLFTGLLSIGDGITKQEFQLPFRNIGSELAKKGLEVPGSALRMRLMKDHALTYGMPEELGILHKGNPVFSTSIPIFDMDRRVIGWFPEDNILMSGYAGNEKLLARKAAMVWIKKAKGHLVLYGFSPHHRGQTPATYKLLFNGVLMNTSL
ncbi:MAG: M14 family metallopeptidase [Bacteroidales bacterium]